MDLTFGTPPPEAFISARAGSGIYGQVAVELRKRPMEWAQFPREYASAESARQAARNIRQGKVKALDAKQYEVMPHEKTLWIRFLADDEGNPPEPVDPGDRDYSPSEVRRWAKRVGIEVGPRGRIPDDVLEQYRAHVEDNDRPGMDDHDEN